MYIVSNAAHLLKDACTCTRYRLAASRETYATCPRVVKHSNAKSLSRDASTQLPHVKLVATEQSSQSCGYCCSKILRKQRRIFSYKLFTSPFELLFTTHSIWHPRQYY